MEQFGPDKNKEHLDQLVDETEEESFPASDPPFWTAGIESENEGDASESELTLDSNTS